MQHVICTGNISREQFEELCTLAPNVHVVAGDYDLDPELAFPETRVLQVGQFRIGVVHGHQLLPYLSKDAAARMRRKLQVDIFISGHAHQNEVTILEEDDGYYYINPGSITGAFSPLTAEKPTTTPSFILLAVQDNKLVCYVYELINGEVEVSKTEFTKKATESSNPSLLQSLLS